MPFPNREQFNNDMSPLEKLSEDLKGIKFEKKIHKVYEEMQY